MQCKMNQFNESAVQAGPLLISIEVYIKCDITGTSSDLLASFLAEHFWSVKPHLPHFQGIKTIPQTLSMQKEIVVSAHQEVRTICMRVVSVVLGDVRVMRGQIPTRKAPGRDRGLSSYFILPPIFATGIGLWTTRIG